MRERIKELAEQAAHKRERIIELAEQAAHNLDPEDCMVSEEFLEAFAELIIQECGKVAYEETGHFPKPCDWLSDKFKRHFGVEE